MESRSCVTITRVIPRSFFNFFMSSSRSAAVTGSSPADGSSDSTSGGSSIMALANPARLSIPPDSSEGRRLAACESCTCSSLCFMICSITSLDRFVCAMSGILRFCMTVMELMRPLFWYMNPMFFRKSDLSSSCSFSISLPRT